MSHPSFPKILTGVVCKECGEVRFNTPSGSVCPNGHGRLAPRVSSVARRVYREYQESLSLSQANRVSGRTYEVDGCLYVRASKETSEIRAGYLGKVIRLKQKKGKVKRVK